MVGVAPCLEVLEARMYRAVYIQVAVVRGPRRHETGQQRHRFF